MEAYTASRRRVSTHARQTAILVALQTMLLLFSGSVFVGLMLVLFFVFSKT